MMLRVMKNSALAAKIHAMTGSTLRPADYEALVQLHSVPGVAAYLNENTRYRKVLESAPITTLHRGGLEQLLHTQILNDILSLLHYTDVGSAFLLKALELQDGTEKLKLFLRLLHIGRQDQLPARALDVRLGPGYLDAGELSRLDSFDALLEYIRPTPYYQALRSFAGDAQRQELFYLETALDAYWARLITRYAKKHLPPEEAKLTLRVYGAQIDLDNLSFLLRCKERFHMREEEIYACVIPYYYRLSKETITGIVDSPATPAALSLIREQTPYGDAFHPEDRFFEKRKNEYLFKLHRRMLANHPYAVQAALSYVQLRRIEIDNIVSIIEGIRYGLKPEQMRENLIGYSKGDEEP